MHKLNLSSFELREITLLSLLLPTPESLLDHYLIQMSDQIGHSKCPNLHLECQ